MARGNERYSTNAYFEMVLTSRLYNALPERVVTNPKFWDFLESTRSKSHNERWAGDILRRNMDMIAARLDDIRANEKTLKVAKAIPSLEHMLLESEETLEARIESLPEGAKLHFLRDVFHVADEAEEEAEQAEEEYQAGTTARQRLFGRDAVRVVESEDRDREGSGSNASGSEAESWYYDWELEQHFQVWEWTESDSEAEHWFFERNAVAAEGRTISPVEVERAWDWSDDESGVEREEVERDSLERMRGSIS